MHGQMEELFDLVIGVVVAALCMSTGVRTVVRDNREVRQYTSSYREKNTTIKYTPSEKVYGDYSGAMTREELVLLTQIQDYEMYGPHIISRGDILVDLHPGYEMYESASRTALWGMLAPDAPESTYQIRYDSESDTYRIKLQTE